MTETEILKLTGVQWWRIRPDDAIVCRILWDDIQERKSRFGLRLYLLKNHYRIIRSDSEATQNPLLKPLLVGTFGKSKTIPQIRTAIDEFNRRQPHR